MIFQEIHIIKLSSFVSVFVNEDKAIDVPSIPVMVAIHLHPDQVGRAQWNTSNTNMLFDKHECGFNIPKNEVKINIHLFLLIFSLSINALAKIPNGIAN
mgnify:CR=1 FL=1